MSDGLNKYLHGTVWMYPSPEKKRGAKRLALVISDSLANMGSPTVNIVVAESGATNEYINVPLNMDAGYQIQCDQIHTVAKEELTEYVGALPAKLLVSVKAKIRAHFNLDEGDNSREELKKSVIGLTEALTKMVSDDEYPGLPASHAIPQINKEPRKAAKITPKPEVSAPDSEAVEDAPPKPAKVKGVRKKSEAKMSRKTGKPVRKLRKYNEEEKAFIADTANSTEDIMKKFELTDKKKAHALRNYVRNRLGKQENPET